MKGYWSGRSVEAIDKAYRGIKAAQPGLTDAEIMRMVSLHYYPFGARENWPYQAWLKAVKNYRQKLGVVTPAEETAELPLFDA
jgi:hypothetical protein